MTDLYERLMPIARALRAQAYPLAKAVALFDGGGVSDADFVALSESAAFLAFTTAGGDVDDPDAFDWSETPGLVRLGLAFLRSDLGFAYQDQVRRATPRKAGHTVAELAWDTWAWAPESERPTSKSRRWSRVTDDYQPDIAFRESMLARLEPLIAETLGAKAARVVCDHYFRGVSQRAIAERLVTEAGDVTPHALERAERAVNQMVSRARTKLRAVLPPEWAALTAEVA